MLSKLPTTPEQYDLLRQIDAAGCPVDFDTLCDPCQRIEIQHLPSAFDTEIFPTDVGLGFLFRLRLTVFAPTWIHRMLIGAHCNESWGWVKKAKCKVGSHYGVVWVADRAMLESAFNGNDQLRKGEMREGYVFLEAKKAADPKPITYVNLRLTDQYERETSWMLELKASSQLVGRGDGRCGFDPD